MSNKKEKTLINTESAHWSLSNVSGSILSTKEAMDDFLKEIQDSLIEDPNNERLLGAEWAYKIAVSQFYNRFSRYYR
jgi:hypothetical protein